MILELFLSLSTWATEPAEVSAECNYESVQKFCDKMKEKEKTQLKIKSPLKFSDGSQMPGIGSIEHQKLDWDERSPKLSYYENKRLQKLFEQVKKYSEESIKQGRTFDQLSDEEKNMLDRINMLGLSDLTSTRDHETCEQNHYVGYTPYTNRVVICPVMLGYPDSAIIMSMSQFLGRSLGTCVTNASDLRFPKKTISKIDPEKHPYNLFCHSGGCESGKGLISCLKEGGFSDGGEVNFDSADGKKWTDFIIKSGFTNKAPELPVRSAKLEDTLKDPKNVEWAHGFIKDHKSCYTDLTDSRIDSGIQDWFGADVTARYLEDHPLKAKNSDDLMAPLAAMIDYSCRYPNADEITQKFHAPVETRFNSAIFTNEKFRKALNCSPQKSIKKNCSVSAFHKGSSNQVPPSTLGAPANNNQ